MKYLYWLFLSKILGKKANKYWLNDKVALPLGVKEFHEWSDRIISGACIPGATPESIKFALADQLLHLGPTVDFEADLYFIKCLRKFAINQVADTMRHEIRDAAKARLAAEQAKLSVAETKTGEVTPLTAGVTHAKEVLSNP